MLQAIKKSEVGFGYWNKMVEKEGVGENQSYYLSISSCGGVIVRGFPQC